MKKHTSPSTKSNLIVKNKITIKNDDYKFTGNFLDTAYSSINFKKDHIRDQDTTIWVIQENQRGSIMLKNKNWLDRRLIKIVTKSLTATYEIENHETHI